MPKQVTYFDPRATDPGFPKGREITVEARTPEEYASHRAAILDPSRGITLIDPLELPETPDPAWFAPESPPPDTVAEIKELKKQNLIALEAVAEIYEMLLGE